MIAVSRRRTASWRGRRRGAATLDYVLVLGAMFPIAGASLYLGSKLIRLVYEMLSILVGWPFM